MASFLNQAYLLKHLDRAGWLRIGIDHPESVAAHSWGVALLCLQFAPKGLNKEKLLTLAILHDLPEVIVGDLTPHDNVSKSEKHSREEAAAQDLLPPELFTLWKEGQEKSSPEAKFLHIMDKLDMALQAKQYQHLTDTTEFLDSAEAIFNSNSIPEELRKTISELLD